MNELDPNDPRPPYQQVANALRAAILTKTLKPGDRVAPQGELAKRYNVARATVQQALRILREEGLVVSRQGSGVFVRERTERPVGLRPHLEHAFSQPHVTVDFAGFSGETLHGALTEPLDRIRSGRERPDSIRVRLLVPDTETPWSLPARVDDMKDSPAFRKRATGIMERHTLAIVDAVNEMGRLGLVADSKAELRVYPAVPLFKLYLINGSEAFFGYYPVREHKVILEEGETPMWDLMGKDATLFHHAAEPGEDTLSALFIEQSQMWFDSIWSTVASEMKR